MRGQASGPSFSFQESEMKCQGKEENRFALPMIGFNESKLQR
jgi:hypothetical protein